jgi:hypothetical protein
VFMCVPKPPPSPPPPPTHTLKVLDLGAMLKANKEREKHQPPLDHPTAQRRHVKSTPEAFEEATGLLTILISHLLLLNITSTPAAFQEATGLLTILISHLLLLDITSTPEAFEETTGLLTILISQLLLLNITFEEATGSNILIIIIKFSYYYIYLLS